MLVESKSFKRIMLISAVGDMAETEMPRHRRPPNEDVAVQPEIST